MAWIKMRTDLARDPHVSRLSKLTALDRNHVIGCLAAVWSAADSYTTDGHIRKVGIEYVDEIAGVTGFGQAMIDIGWLRLDRRNGDIRFPHWHHHNGPTAKTRAQAARRMKSARSGSSGDVAPEAQHERNGSPTPRCAQSAPTAEERRGEKKRTAAGRTAVVDALLKAGVAEPVLTELAETGLTAGLIDYHADRLSRKGLGTGALVHELRAWLAKTTIKKGLQRKTTRT
jgi:hypothetical protein